VQGNHITIELALPNLVVERRIEQGETITVEVRFRWEKRVLLLLRKRWFRCTGCGKIFMERDEVCGWRRRCTQELREHVAQESSTRTVKGVAGKEGVSEALVRRAFTEMARRELDRVEPTPRP